LIIIFIMPRSKKFKTINLTKTNSKGKEAKKLLIDKVRECFEKYNYLYVFSIYNIRSNFMQEARKKWRNSRFFLGKNKVLQTALGKTPEEEYRENLYLISEDIVGNCGLFFTNEPEKDILK
jgi:mRNA turnover protein 4